MTLVISEKKSQDTPKKVAEERQSSSSIERKNVFDEGLGDSDYINIFYNCLKNLSTKDTEIFDLANTTNENQVKSTRQLENLTYAVGFIRKKFEHYKRQQKKRQKDEAIKSIRGKVSSAFKNLENLKHDKQEQCSRRNCFLILDISENNYKDADKLVWKTLKSDANNDTKIEQNDQMHWIESFKKDSGNRKSIPNEVCAICPRK